MPQLDSSRWKHSNLQTLVTGDEAATFKHSQTLNAGDILKMTVEGGGGMVGFAGEMYDPERHRETQGLTAWVGLTEGKTFLNSALSLDGLQRSGVVKPYIHAQDRTV